MSPEECKMLKVGDRVLFRTENRRNLLFGDMRDYLGTVVTILKNDDYSAGFRIEEDSGRWVWGYGFIECKEPDIAQFDFDESAFTDLCGLC